MYSTLLYLVTLGLLPSITLQTLITFSNPTSPSPTTQLCTDGGFLDICCIPLDLDLNDGLGYGWFHSQRITFSDLGSIDIYTAAFRNHPMIGSCRGDAVHHSWGHDFWMSQTYGLGLDFSGGMVLRSFRPALLRKRCADEVIVRGVRYRLIKQESNEEFVFKNALGGEVRGRVFEDGVGSGKSNITEQIDLESVALINQTALVASKSIKSSRITDDKGM